MSGLPESNEGQGNAQPAKHSTGIKKRNELTQERVRELFDYDPNTGIVTRRLTINYKAQVGMVVGSKSVKGYLYVSIDGRSYRLHRVIWLWLYGYFPEQGVDHKNRDKLDHTSGNLRVVSQSCNLKNASIRSDNSTGIKGVGWYKNYNKWMANISLNGANKRLGYFEDFTEAVAHRLAAEQVLNWAGCDSSSSAYRYMQNYLQELKCQES